MTRPAWGKRVAALVCYAGLAPLVAVWRRKKRSEYIAVHCSQALVLFAFLGIIVVLVSALVLILSYGMVHHRQLVERWPSEVWLLSLGRKLLIVWGVFWGYALFRALRGSARPVPYMSFALRCQWLQRAGAAFLCAVLLTLLAFIPVIIMAELLVTDNAERGKVFMVYDDLGRFPRPLFSFAMYPVARAAVTRYGPDSAVLLPISRVAIETALTRGTYVVIASHGTARGLLLDGGYYTPEDVPSLDEHASLQFVYLAGCDSGAQRLAWEKALRPAAVKTYDRLTPVIEHFWWFWTQGPQRVRELS